LFNRLRNPLLLAALLLPNGVTGATTVVQESLALTAERLTSPARPGELADLVVDIGYRPAMTQADYPDFIALEADLRRWLAHAAPAAEAAAPPRPWTRLLGELADRVLSGYAPIDRVTLTVQPYPSPAQPSPGEVMVTAERGAAPRTALRVAIRRHGLDHQGPNVIDLLATARFATAADAARGPGTKALRQELIDLMAAYPTETDYWETLIKALGSTVLERHRSLDRIELRLTVHPTASLTYPHQVSARVERAPPEAVGSGAPSAAESGGPEVIHLADQPWYEAEDRAVARELVSPRNASTEALSIAEIRVPPGVTVRPHRHHMEEVYHVLAGEGVVMVEDRTQSVVAGDTVLIPPQAWHNIVNAGETELRLHVTCVPAWAPEHLIFERASD